MRLRLPCDRASLAALSIPVVIWSIVLRRMFIRYHRDQRGDNRCFLDDWFVWWFLSDTWPIPHFTAELGMVQCELFYRHRHSDDVDTMPLRAILDPAHWDDDLWEMDDWRLVQELYRIQQTIRIHRNISDRPRTTDDDRALYSVLPERIAADFRLGSESEFLGLERAPVAGCPSFWASHKVCDSARCNLHDWGQHCPAARLAAG